MFTTNFLWGIHEYAPAAALRRRVFMEELGMPEANAFDAYDEIAAHLLVSEGAVNVAAARIFPTEDGIQIDSICVLPEYRRRGYGDLCARVLLFKAQDLEQPTITAVIPQNMLPYYAGFGFTTRETLPDGRLKIAVDADSINWHSMCKHE
ncbi:MAG: GNAT family N-acetyltransferase [Eubacteriales bacterium]|nr:GNAT family N-acetyltransferase [Eubacteriales bacterium]